MYFPFLYGRMYELLALRAMLNDYRSLDAFVPVVEPVNAKPNPLATCIERYGEVGQAIAVIVNPDKHELKGSAPAKKWRAEILPVVAKYASVLPTFRIGSATSWEQVSAFVKHFKSRDIAIAYASPTLTDAQVAALAALSNIRFHIVSGKMTVAQRGLLPKDKRITIADFFNKQERNSDYADPELFTDRHRTYAKSWAGFGDFASIGSAFTAGGGEPAAVALHAIYKDASTSDLWIEHFLSDDVVKGVGSTAGKFLQAAAKLVDAATSRPGEFGSNFALDQYATCVENDHSPGLGKNKEFQVSHHMCLMLDVLSGAV